MLVAIHPAAAQVGGEDFGITGIVLGGGGDIRRASSILSHSPADDAGIKKGDAIVAINGVGVVGVEMNELVAKVRGKPGSEVVLVLVSHETGVAFSVTLKRVSYLAYRAANPFP